MFSFSNDHMTVMKDGTPFFVSPISNPCMASLHVGMVLPEIRLGVLPEAGSTILVLKGDWVDLSTSILVAGGNCCHGYLIGVSPEAKITKILAIDFNVRRIVPIIYKSDVGMELGLLVSGAGCSGSGVRFVDFNRKIPVSTTVVGSEEKVKSYESWLYGADPLSVADIWDRLQKIGILADQERTAEAIKTFAFFS